MLETLCMMACSALGCFLGVTAYFILRWVAGKRSVGFDEDLNASNLEIIEQIEKLDVLVNRIIKMRGPIIDHSTAASIRAMLDRLPGDSNEGYTINEVYSDIYNLRCTMQKIMNELSRERGRNEH